MKTLILKLISCSSSILYSPCFNPLRLTPAKLTRLSSYNLIFKVLNILLISFFPCIKINLTLTLALIVFCYYSFTNFSFTYVNTILIRFNSFGLINLSINTSYSLILYFLDVSKNDAGHHHLLLAVILLSLYLICQPVLIFFYVI